MAQASELVTSAAERVSPAARERSRFGLPFR